MSPTATTTTESAASVVRRLARRYEPAAARPSSLRSRTSISAPSRSISRTQIQGRSRATRATSPAPWKSPTRPSTRKSPVSMRKYPSAGSGGRSPPAARAAFTSCIHWLNFVEKPDGNAGPPSGSPSAA